MDIIINNHKAVIKKGSSFDYVSENRSFSDADDYTMSITLPLKGCPENREIFGHIDRMDTGTRAIIFEAAIIDRDFSKFGVITIINASETDIKVQFLEGRSAQNFLNDFDTRYINELPLGSYPGSTLPASPASVLGSIDTGAREVALPWVYDSSGDINNEMIMSGEDLVWGQFTVNTGKLSYQPYLITIATRICEALGYTYDFSQWENSDQVHLLVCNTLPAAWDIPQYARALPHWSVAEFFDELEKILVCEIEIDHKAKHISLVMSDNIEWAENEICLQDSCIVDSFNSEVSYQDTICRFRGAANFRYESREDEMWKLDQCKWLVDLLKQQGKYYTEFETLAQLRTWALSINGGLPFVAEDEERGSDMGQLIHVLENNAYYMWIVSPSGNALGCTFGLREVNRFGDVVNDPDSDNDITLGCVPARLDQTDYEHGHCLFLAPANFNEKEELDSNGVRQPAAYSTFLKGEPDEVAEYYDKILLAYWDGESSNEVSNFLDLSFTNRYLPPAPFVDRRFSLERRYRGYLSGLKVMANEKMKVSWLSSSIPNVRAVFHIRGRKYLCEKITATFTENGMSQLLKGEFYPILDE